MNRTHVYLYVIAAALVGTFIVVWSYPRFKVIEKRGRTSETVAAILPADVDSASLAIRRLFNEWEDFNRVDRAGVFHNKFPADSNWSKFFLFRNEVGPQSLFPTDEELLRDHGADSSVERYVHIPAPQRMHDFYLYEPTGDYYWNSEYYYDGQPAKFRCSFIIHEEAIDSFSTKLEVFEYQPEIWVGKYFGLSAHSIFPAMLYDIRPAEATGKDRNDILTLIQSTQSEGSIQ